MAERERDSTHEAAPRGGAAGGGSARGGAGPLADQARAGAPELARAARLLEVRPPAEELKRFVQARMEALARLEALDDDAEGGPPAPLGAAGAERLALHREALEVALGLLREART